MPETSPYENTRENSLGSPYEKNLRSNGRLTQKWNYFIYKISLRELENFYMDSLGKIREYLTYSLRNIETVSGGYRVWLKSQNLAFLYFRFMNSKYFIRQYSYRRFLKRLWHTKFGLCQFSFLCAPRIKIFRQYSYRRWTLILPRTSSCYLLKIFSILNRMSILKVIPLIIMPSYYRMWFEASNGIKRDTFN